MTNLGLMYLDPISSRLNGRLGEALSRGHRSITDAIFTTRTDGTTYLLLYHLSTQKMNPIQAADYCLSLGMGLPIVDSDLTAVRFGIFAVVNGDFAIDGTDVGHEGVFHSTQFPGRLLNGLRWGPRVSGTNKHQNCVKHRLVSTPMLVIFRSFLSYQF